MLENSSARARHVVSLAAAEARRLGHPHVGTEHLLLGLLADDGPTAALLRGAGVTSTGARHKVTEVAGGNAATDGDEPLPYTARAQRALERAGRFSRHDRAATVSSAHLLLGVLDVEGLACQVLRGLGVDIVHLRDAVAGSAADAVPDAAVEARADPHVAGPNDAGTDGPRCPRCRSSVAAGGLIETVVPARRDGRPPADVSIVSCAACGTALGALRPAR